jgi:hypothetical protein
MFFEWVVVVFLMIASVVSSIMEVKTKNFSWCTFQLFFHPWLCTWILMYKYKRDPCPLHKPRLSHGEWYINLKWHKELEKLGQILFVFFIPKFIFSLAVVCCMDVKTKQIFLCLLDLISF